MAVRAVRRQAVRSVSLLLSDPEDLGRFVDELAACRRRGQRPAGPVGDGESGGTRAGTQLLDRVHILLEGGGSKREVRPELKITQPGLGAVEDCL